MVDETRFVIRFVDSWSIDEIVQLYKAGGWWKDSYDSSGIPGLIKGSYVFAVVVDSTNGTAIGMGRVLSDGVSDAYIQDVLILSKYRRSGIGKKLVQSLIDYCLSHGITWIGLMAEPGSEQFYTASGFHVLKGYSPMRYHLTEE